MGRRPDRLERHGAFVGTFCVPRTDSALINTVNGLPGPAAIVVPVEAEVVP